MLIAYSRMKFDMFSAPMSALDQKLHITINQEAKAPTEHLKYRTNIIYSMNNIVITTYRVETRKRHILHNRYETTP